MGSITPLATAVAIIVVVALVGAIAAFIRDRRLLSGYEEIESDIQFLKDKLTADVFRDGEDLVISGMDARLPVVVRFSYSENTPGMNIRVHAAATMNLAVVPKNSSFVVPEFMRVNVNTPDEMFNARFFTRTDDSAAARMFLLSRAVMKELQKACCSSRTMLHISRGIIELNETTVPQPYTGRHVGGHIESLIRFAKVLAEMPGANLVPVKAPERDRHLVLKSAIAVGVVAAVVTVVGATKNVNKMPQSEVPVVQQHVSGVLPIDAPAIGDLNSYRVLTVSEMDPDLVAWVRGMGAEPTGRVQLDLSGDENPTDTAYLLTNEQGQRRVVLMKSGRNLWDGRFFGTMMIGRIRRDDFNLIQWRSPEQSAPPDGDGLFFLQNKGDDNSAVVLYLRNGKLVIRPITNWQSAPIR